MPVTVTRLTPRFAARITAWTFAARRRQTWAEIRAAFEEHSVLVVRGQPLDDEGQIAFEPPLRRARDLAEHEPGGGHAVRAPVQPRHRPAR